MSGASLCGELSSTGDADSGSPSSAATQMPLCSALSSRTSTRSSRLSNFLGRSLEVSWQLSPKPPRTGTDTSLARSQVPGVYSRLYPARPAHGVHRHHDQLPPPGQRRGLRAARDRDWSRGELGGVQSRRTGQSEEGYSTCGVSEWCTSYEFKIGFSP